MREELENGRGHCDTARGRHEGRESENPRIRESENPRIRESERTTRGRQCQRTTMWKDENPRGREEKRMWEDKNARELREDALELVKWPCHGNWPCHSEMVTWPFHCDMTVEWTCTETRGRVCHTCLFCSDMFLVCIPAYNTGF